MKNGSSIYLCSRKSSARLAKLLPILSARKKVFERFPTDLDRTVLSRHALEKYLENPEVETDIYIRG